MRPVTLNPVPLRLACEIVTLDAPEFVKVSVRLFELPVCTLPKLRAAGLGLSVPGGKTPVPASATVRFGLDPLEVIDKLALTVPATDGVNFRVKLVLWPALRVSGRVSPVKLNPEPAVDACEMVRLDPPELVSVSDRLWLLPTCTLPKS